MNRLFGALSLAILAVACSLDGKGAAKPVLGDGGTTYTATASTQSIVDQLMSAECDGYVRCGYLPDKTTCLVYFKHIGALNDGTLAYSIDQGRTSLNQSNLAGCLSAMSNKGCVLSESSVSALQPSCGSIMIGTISSGGDCIDDGECKTGLECDKGSCTDSCCAGVCVATKPKAQVGGACTSDSICVDTAYCKQTYNLKTQTIDGICQARVAVGMACTDSGSCVGSAQCTGTTGSKTCMAPAKDGAACGANGVLCENTTSYCDPVTGTCQPRIKDNSPCVLPDAGVVAALSSGCFNFSQCKNGVCKRLPMEGEACSNPDAAWTDECLIVGKCVNGFCQADPSKPVCSVAVAKAAAADAGVRD